MDGTEERVQVGVYRSTSTANRAFPTVVEDWRQEMRKRARERW